MTSPPQKKRNADYVKWTALALAIIFALTTVIAAAASGNVKVSGSTLTGTVTAVDGNSITISLTSGKESFSFGGMNGNMNGQMPQGTPPDRQDADNQTTEESDNNDAQSDTRQGNSDSMPQRPDNLPDMPGGFAGSNRTESGDAGEITVRLGIGTTVSNGTEKSSTGEICVGDSVTLTFGAFNTVKSVAVSSTQSEGFFFNQD